MSIGKCPRCSQLLRDCDCEESPTPNKYLRRIRAVDGPLSVNVDVYAVMKAFDVRCPATQHALKKLLCPGQRGTKSILEDLREARDSLDRVIQMAGENES